jgi:type II secretory pathway pseudopilin PulG
VEFILQSKQSVPLGSFEVTGSQCLEISEVDGHAIRLEAHPGGVTPQPCSAYRIIPAEVLAAYVRRVKTGDLPWKNENKSGFTRLELIVVVCIVAVLAVAFAAFLAWASREKALSARSCCVNNLAQIGTAYRLWANDHKGLFPSSVSTAEGGWKDILSQSNASAWCWTNYAIMQNELGQAPIIVTCVTDERRAVNSFLNLSDNSVSFFVGVEANPSSPNSILAGDRNLGSGTEPDAQYGFSPSDGQGNDVRVKEPICWSLKMHSRGKGNCGGELLLVDGSVHWASSDALARFVQNDLKGRTSSTNAAGVRFIFP